jgi:hypothetical protein
MLLRLVDLNINNFDWLELSQYFVLLLLSLLHASPAQQLLKCFIPVPVTDISRYYNSTWFLLMK